jgi:hypothetical protein
MRFSHHSSAVHLCGAWAACFQREGSNYGTMRRNPLIEQPLSWKSFFLTPLGDLRRHGTAQWVLTHETRTARRQQRRLLHQRRRQRPATLHQVARHILGNGAVIVAHLTSPRRRGAFFAFSKGNRRLRRSLSSSSCAPMSWLEGQSPDPFTNTQPAACEWRMTAAVASLP